METDGVPKVTIGWCCEVTIGVDELWVDGDAPQAVDARAVADLITQHGGIETVIVDWNLWGDLEAWVEMRSLNPHWREDVPLFPGHAPAKWLTTRVDL